MTSPWRRGVPIVAAALAGSQLLSTSAFVDDAVLASGEPATFGIYTARLDGSDLRPILTSQDHEMSHPRVSPDGTRLVFTRYNNRRRDGRAVEELGYDNTEILVMNLDGTGLETVVPPRAGVIAANGDWTADGRSLIFVSTDNRPRAAEIRRIELATRETTRIPTPPGLKVSDPHWLGNTIVFPVKAEGGAADALWLMSADGTGARQITHPPRLNRSKGNGLHGDFDPKLSPDGTKVAFMRNDGGENWRILTVDLASGEERLLTPKGSAMQWLPTWSSDGRLLLYVHVDRKRPRDIGLYTMTPDGRDRRMVPLPRGHLWGHSSFLPGEGSSGKARIIFNGMVVPGI